MTNGEFIWCLFVSGAEKYGGMGYVPHRKRLGGAATHFVHPLVARLSGQTINIRSKKTKYQPSFLVESSV